MAKLKLTEDQLSEILAVLHDTIQFYDESGEMANGKILNQVESALRNAAGLAE